MTWGEGVLSILWRLYTERLFRWNFYTLTQVSDKIDLAKYCCFLQYQFFMQPNHTHFNCLTFQKFKDLLVLT